MFALSVGVCPGSRGFDMRARGFDIDYSIDLKIFKMVFVEIVIFGDAVAPVPVIVFNGNGFFGNQYLCKRLPNCMDRGSKG